MPDNSADLLSYYDLVHRILLKLTHDENAADDIAQQTYLQALRYTRSRGPPTKPRAWLIAIAKNAARDYFGGQRSTTSIETYADILWDGRESPLEVAITEDEAQHVREVYRYLRAIDKDVLKRFYEQGQGCTQIGLEHGITSSSAKVRLHRARQRLKRLLEADGE